MDRLDVSKILVTRSNDLVYSPYRMSIQEFRLVAFFIGLIRLDDDEFKTYEIDVVDLQEYLGVNSKDIYQIIDRSTDEIMKRFVSIPKGKKKRSWEKIKWVDKIEYIDGEDSESGRAALKFRFNDQLKPFLLDLKKRFASVPFEKLRKVASINSARVFETLFHLHEEKKKEEFEVDLEDFKRSLVLEGKYVNYRDFRVNVLERAQKDCEKYTGLAFTFTPKKKSRKVVAINFTINRKSFEPIEGYSEEVKEQLERKVEQNIPQGTQDSKLVRNLQKIGFSGDIPQVIVKHGEQNIQAVLDYAVACQEKQKGTDDEIRNLAGFLNDLIKNNYWEVIALERKTQEKESEIEKESIEQGQKAQKARELAKIIRKDFEKAVKAHVDVIWLKLKESDKNKIRQHNRKAIPTVLLDAYDKAEAAEKEGVMTEAYRYYIKTTLQELGYLKLEDDLEDVIAFAKTRAENEPELQQNGNLLEEVIIELQE